MFGFEKRDAFIFQLMCNPDAGRIEQDRLPQVVPRHCLEIIFDDVDLDT
ncbi:hypothetical protein YGS_C1P0169 [Sphingobium sp. YG1]|nr:hypothetical protein YGS_C1P0169 [Sphingobium sp. YG1]